MIALIAAMSTNRVIGYHGKLPWHLPCDFKYFKETTLNHTIVMGRNTFESIGKPLPSRRNIVLSRNTHFKATGVEVFSSLNSILNNQPKKETLFIIGGSQIYQQAISIADKIYLTQVHTEIEGDAFFPEINLNEWQLASNTFVAADEKNKFDMSFQVFCRKDNVPL